VISLETARQLLDFQGGTPTQKARLSVDRAEEQLQGAVAIHNILEQHHVAYLADEVGLGKTYVALGAFALFRHFNPAFRLLVIAPKENIQRKWIKELQNFVRNNVRLADLRVRSIHGTPARPPVFCSNLLELIRETALDPDRDFFARLTSFGFGLSDEASDGWRKRRDRIRHLLPWIGDHLFDLKSKTRFKENYARATACALPEFDLVIVDEGHNLKHGLHKSAALRNHLLAMALGNDPQCEKSILKSLPHYGPRAKRVLFLSATPLEDDYRHIWNQLDVVGFGHLAPELADKSVPEDVKRELVSKFLVRRVSRIRTTDRELTKNLYRREWRQGGVAVHDETLPLPDDRQRLVVALVQKKVSELLAHERFNHSFQIGMLASFESFLQTAKVGTSDETATFDDADQTDNELERQGIDVEHVNRLASSYEKRFGSPLPHPKMDALVESLRESFNSGRKALVFVRRVASVKEIEQKLEVEYDRWLIARLENELSPTLQPALAKVVEQYRSERAVRDLRKIREQQHESRSDDDADPELQEVRDATEDQGGIDTFFAWFFRGEGPAGVLSGAELSKRFLRPQFGLSSFFEENYAAALLGARPGSVLAALCAHLQQPDEVVRRELETRAGRLLRTEQRRKRHRHLFIAFQAAAVSLIAEKSGDLRAEAELTRRELLVDQSDAPPVSLGTWLERATFFTELRARDSLRDELWFPTEEQTLKVEPRFHRRELRRELLRSMFRLGHSLIDLFVVVINRLGRLERAGDGEDLDNQLLANDLLDLLEHQRDSGPFRAYHELRQAASHFDAIVDINVRALWDRELSEVSRDIGNLLREQQPIGGMFGQVNKTLVSQFRMPGYPLVLITTDLLQEGEDLHLFCSDVYHYGISWMPSSMEQRIGRIDRVRSQTENRLTALDRAPEGRDLLQVYFPYVPETVEVFQVNRVLERMDRFIRLMHENLGTPKDGDDRRINLADEIGRAARPRSEASREPLRSSFPVRRELLRGKKEPLAVSHEVYDELVLRFRLLQDQLHKAHGIHWQPRGPLHGTAVSSASAGSHGSAFLRRSGSSM
jgi:hypothetical protein